MAEKQRPIGICDHCGGPIPAGDWYTSKGRPRLYCSIDCRNTANSRAGNPVRVAKLRRAVAEGRWRNPAHLRPPTSAEQAARARKGRLREVAEGRWRNPALDPDARAKLSRPRVHGDDPALHRALERLRQGARVADLSPDEAEAHRAYRRALRRARLDEVRAYYRVRYRRLADDPDARERLRALWRRQNRRRKGATHDDDATPSRAAAGPAG